MLYKGHCTWLLCKNAYLKILGILFLDMISLRHKKKPDCSGLFFIECTTKTNSQYFLGRVHSK
jgi:hypothetical protein